MSVVEDLVRDAISAHSSNNYAINISGDVLEVSVWVEMDGVLHSLVVSNCGAMVRCRMSEKFNLSDPEFMSKLLEWLKMLHVTIIHG